MGSSFVPKMGGETAAISRASRAAGPTMAAVPCGINGFGRIGRLVARIMTKDPETNVSLRHDVDMGLAVACTLAALRTETVRYLLRCL